MVIERFRPELHPVGNGMYIPVMEADPQGEYVHMPDDGRPCHTDVLISLLLGNGVPKDDFRNILWCWNEGDWPEALEIAAEYGVQP